MPWWKQLALRWGLIALIAAALATIATLIEVL